ncbi:MAG: hypothetical protein K6F64_05735 [Clostridia bacterium]|nr:hypothetical protein [Clostridia bacterium]
MSKYNKIISYIIVAVTVFTLLPLKAAAQENILLSYPEYDERITQCYEYEVSVTQNNKTIPLKVYDRCNSSTLLGNRTKRPDMHRRFCEFAFSGESVTVNIRVRKDFRNYSVIPSAKQFPVSFSDGVISVTVSEPDDYFILRLDSDDNTVLSVFADKPETDSYIKSDESVLILDDKWNEMSSGEYLTIDGKSSFVKSESDGKTLLTRANNSEHPVTSVYVAPGCVLNSRVRIEAAGVKISGHGIILDPYSDIFAADIRNAPDKFFVLLGAADCSVRDLKILDSQNYSLTLGWLCDRTVIENVKILASTMCTDGVSVFESRSINIKNNFIYAGDNAIVFGGDCSGSDFENNIIGTTCAAFFPQSSISGTVTFRDSFVFRCDEGCVNNWYGASGDGSEIENIIFDRLDCTDVTVFPWLFCARNQGSPAKNFTFINTSIVSSRGTAYITEPANGKSVIISVDSQDEFPACGYRLAFNNLFVDGICVTSADDLVYSAPDNSVTMNFTSTDNCEINLHTSESVVNYIYPYKIFIGGCETFLSGCPAENENGILLPAEILSRLAIEDKSKIVTVEGKIYIQLNDLSSYCAGVSYDKAKGIISIKKPSYKTDNLIKDNALAFSRWTEMICYESGLTTSTSGGDCIYCLDVDSKNSAAGMKTFITDEILRNGSGRYRLAFSAKTAAKTKQKLRVGLSTVPQNCGYYEHTAELTGKWQSFSFAFDLSGADLNAVTDVFISLSNKGNSGFSAQFKDFAFYYEDGPDSPDNPAPPSTYIPEAYIINGNSPDNRKTYGYRTTVTFTAVVPEGGSVQWYVDSNPAGNGNTLTVKDKTNDYTVKVVVTDKSGKKTMDEEQVTIRHGFFDILIWFFVHLFNPGAYDIKQ